MAPMLIALIASAALADQKAREDMKNYKDQQKVEAAKQRFSAFTGQRGQTLGRPNSSNTMMQALISGALMGKQLSTVEPTTAAGAAGSMLGNMPQTSGPMGMGQQQQMPGQNDPRNFYA